jgi:hypothetical protein
MGQNLSTTGTLRFHIVKEGAEAQRLLDEAEKKDFYLADCKDDHANALSRDACSYTVRAMTLHDYKLFEVVVENTRDLLPKRLLHELSTVYLVQLNQSAEGGMPHTRPDAVICYPDISHTFSVITLLHELWHVHQRQHEAWWREVLARLGWQPWQEGQLPLRLESHRRFNPDTIDSPLWCYRQTWVPVPVFRDVTRPRVGEVMIWFYHITLKYHVKSPPREMEEMYRGLPMSAYEHPRELVAYLLSDPARHSECPALGQLIDAVGAISLPSE